MIYKINNKSFIISIIEYIVMFLIILKCNSLFFPFTFKIIFQFFILLLFIYSFLNIKKNHNDLSTLYLFMTFFVLITSLFLIFNFYVYHYSLSNIYTFLIQPIMFIVYMYSFIENKMISQSLFFKLENIVLCLAIISLFFWILIIIGIKPNSYIVSNWTVQGQIVPGYFHLSYFSQGKVDFLGLNIIRNTGLFNEAPMYSYILSIALLIELFMKKSKLLNYRTVILTITILTTTSSTGVIVALMSLIYSILMINNKNKLLVILLGLILIPIAVIFINMIMIDKIGTGTNLNSSFNIRMNDIIACFNTWKQHLIIGNGINNNDSIIKNMATWRLIPNVAIGLSTGFMSILAYGGIALSSFYILPTILVMKISSRFSGLAIFSFILFIFTMIPTSNIYILLLSYFWTVFIYNKDKNLRRNI